MICLYIVKELMLLHSLGRELAEAVDSPFLPTYSLRGEL